MTWESKLWITNLLNYIVIYMKFLISVVILRRDLLKELIKPEHTLTRKKYKFLKGNYKKPNFPFIIPKNGYKSACDVYSS